MKEQVEKLQMVKNTLEAMEIKPSQRNSTLLAGVYSFIDEVIISLNNQDTKKDEPAVTEDQL